MKKLYYLDTCSTCNRIIKLIGLPNDVIKCNIKVNHIDEETLDFLAEKTGSYESLFSRRAIKYRQMGLHEKKLTPQDYKKYILEEYTFIKRPILIYENRVFIGNSKKVVAGMLEFLKGK